MISLISPGAVLQISSLNLANTIVVSSGIDKVFFASSLVVNSSYCAVVISRVVLVITVKIVANVIYDLRS